MGVVGLDFQWNQESLSSFSHLILTICVLRGGPSSLLFMHSESLSSFSHIVPSIILIICVLGENPGPCGLGRVEGPNSPSSPKMDELRIWWELLVWTPYAFIISAQLFSYYSDNMSLDGRPQFVAIYVGSKSWPVFHPKMLWAQNVMGVVGLEFLCIQNYYPAFSYKSENMRLGGNPGPCDLGKVEGPTSYTFPKSDDLRMCW